MSPGQLCEKDHHSELSEKRGGIISAVRFRSPKPELKLSGADDSIGIAGIALVFGDRSLGALEEYGFLQAVLKRRVRVEGAMPEAGPLLDHGRLFHRVIDTLIGDLFRIWIGRSRADSGISEVGGSIHVKWMPALAAETCLAAFLASPPLPSPLVLGSINCDRCSPGKVSGRQGSSIFRAHALSRCGPVAQECWRGRGVPHHRRKGDLARFPVGHESLVLPLEIGIVPDRDHRGRLPVVLAILGYCGLADLIWLRSLPASFCALATCPALSIRLSTSLASTAFSSP